MSIRLNRIRQIAMSALLVLVFACGCVIPEQVSSAEPLKIGLMLRFSSSPETAADRQRGFDLAIRHINEEGGVLGRPVVGVTADATRSPGPAVEAARRLVEEEGVHAIVGPTASAAALAVIEIVTGPAGIPTISPSATSPQLTRAADNDFFFRTTLSDTAQGPVLARVAQARGFDNVGLIYIDDAYGQGLAASFEEAWQGTLQAIAVDADLPTYLPQLQESAGAGGQALVVITFESQALAIVREAIDEGIYSQFVFDDAAKRISLVREIGGPLLGGMYGAAGAPMPHNDATAAWEDEFMAAYGALPTLTYVKETYDATIALALAAQAAGSQDGFAIRDHLRVIGGPPGQVVLGSGEGVAEALGLLAEGREIDYEGVASTLDWDENGDLQRGYIGIWRFTQDEDIEEIETVFFQQ